MTKHLSITRYSFGSINFFNSHKIILSKEIMETFFFLLIYK